MPLRGFVNHSWQSASVEVWRLPCVHTRLPLKGCQKTVIRTNMRGNCDATLLSDTFQKVNAIFVAVRGRHTGITDALLSNKSLKAIVLIRVIKAQKMNPVF